MEARVTQGCSPRLVLVLLFDVVRRLLVILSGVQIAVYEELGCSPCLQQDCNSLLGDVKVELKPVDAVPHVWREEILVSQQLGGEGECVEKD